ncbi:putative ribonuclease H-like domain-containing protein [Tanacetum coccineum]
MMQLKLLEMSCSRKTEDLLLSSMELLATVYSTYLILFAHQLVQPVLLVDLADFINLESTVNVCLFHIKDTLIHPTHSSWRSKICSSNMGSIVNKGRTVAIQDSEGMDSCRFAYEKKAVGTNGSTGISRMKECCGLEIRQEIEAIRIFLAFASYMGFIVYQMDVKSAFSYGNNDEEVYVSQPQGFVVPKFPKKVYKVVKDLYGLHQAPRAWSWCDEFEALMKSRFQISSMGKLTLFLGLQVKQKEDGIFISQDKYVAEILKKFDFASMKTDSYYNRDPSL